LYQSVEKKNTGGTIRGIPVESSEVGDKRGFPRGFAIRLVTAQLIGHWLVNFFNHRTAARVLQ